MLPIDRRCFLALASTGPVAAPLLADQKKAPPLMPIIDTHQHLWDLGRFRLPWVAKKSLLDRNFLLSDYDAAVKGLNVVQAVYMEVDVDPKQQQDEADHLIGICKKGDAVTTAAVISGRPGDEGFVKYAGQFKNSPYIKGIRRVLHGAQTPAGHCLEKAFVQGVQFLGDIGLRFDLCMRHGELPDAAKLIDACPGTKFVLDHLGNPDLKKHEQWKKDIAALAKRKNLVCKVSGIVASAEPKHWKSNDLAPVVNHVLDEFGPDRVMFGGDWPVCLRAATFAQWVTALKEIVSNRKPEMQRKLFHDNALAFYGLKAKK